MDEDQDAEPQAPALRFVGTPSQVKSLYADACTFVSGLGHTARLQFTEAIPGALDSTDPGIKIRYVFNLIMPHDGLIGMVKYILSSLPEENREEILGGF